jgi:hypothetical protein
MLKHHVMVQVYDVHYLELGHVRTSQCRWCSCRGHICTGACHDSNDQLRVKGSITSRSARTIEFNYDLQLITGSH